MNDQYLSVVKDACVQQPIVAPVTKEITARGGTTLLVGGAVRDALLGNTFHDVDIEVYGIPLEQLQHILATYGTVRVVGKMYGVLRVDGCDIDWSLPRADGAGRKPTVIVDPNMSYRDAFERRDLTINALGIDCVSGELIDPFNGVRDLYEGVLRAPSIDRFVEDPLRFFRVMHFIGRFEMIPDHALTEVCTSMSLTGIASERIFDEIRKLLQRSRRPSLGFRWVAQCGRLQELFPELFATVGVAQDPEWHPEGDVFEHSLQALDAARALSDDHDRFLLCLAALCHDVGKVTTSAVIDGRIRSRGHDVAGVEPTRALLARLTNRKDIVPIVTKLVRWHMAPGQFVSGGARCPAYKRLAYKLAPHASLQMLCALSRADKRGRNAKSPEPLQHAIYDVDAFEKRARSCGVYSAPEEPVLTGSDLIACGVAPGARMGDLLQKAYVLQIEEGITSRQELLTRILDR